MFTITRKRLPKQNVVHMLMDALKRFLKPMAKHGQTLKPNQQTASQDPFLSDRASFELYQAFMVGYVRRVNEATFNVTIGGVKIGSAKYSRLAQINLQSRIITFSRFAVENVSERGRRYLVLHELAHVHEPSHDKRFWGFVEKFEPDYKVVGHELEQSFKKNVRAELQRQKKLNAPNPLGANSDERKKILSSRLLNYEMAKKHHLHIPPVPASPAHLLEVETEILTENSNNSHENIEIKQIIDPYRYEFQQEQNTDTSYDWMEDEVNAWDNEELAGTVNGGCLE